jgi:hypothetical protein
LLVHRRNTINDNRDVAWRTVGRLAVRRLALSSVIVGRKLLDLRMVIIKSAVQIQTCWEQHVVDQDQGQDQDQDAST